MDARTTSNTIRNAIGGHATGKLQIRTAARAGDLPAAVQTIAADDQGAFRRLLNALAPELEGGVDFAAIRVLQADVHASAGRIAQVIVAGDSARVSFELGAGGSFEHRSQVRSNRLADWRIKLKDRSGPTAVAPVSRRDARN